jgi:5'-nucleotidase
MSKSKVAVGLATCVLALGSAVVSADGGDRRPPATVEGLRILIVNDDSVQGTAASGRDGEGLYELRKAMCAAGADVLVVGPWAVQSGMGGRITLSGPLTVQEVTPPAAYQGDCTGAASGGHVFGVCASAAPCTPTSPSGSPSDSSRVALERFLPDNYWAEGPDIVLSGINFGQNEALGVFHSGTTSAAVTAFEHGYPAIAFSEQLDPLCITAGTDCPEFITAAGFAVELVGKVREAGLISPDLLLNVNHPHIAPGEQLLEPQLNVLGHGATLTFDLNGDVPAAGGTYTVGLGEPIPEPRNNADTTAITENHISIVPLDGDWTADKVPGRLKQVVKSFS